MFSYLKIAAVAFVASTGMAAAVTVDGTLQGSGTYSVDGGGPVLAGSTLSVGSSNAGFGMGDYAGIASVSNFSLIVSNVPSSTNAGTSFTFGMFTFTIASTTIGTVLAGNADVIGLGTVTGGGFDASPSSFNFAISSADDTAGFFNLRIATPPDDIALPPVPLPAGLPLLIGGLAVFGIARSRRKA